MQEKQSMATVQLKNETSGQWLLLVEGDRLAESTPSLLVGSGGIELWIIPARLGGEEGLAAVRFPAGWSAANCWAWSLAHLLAELSVALPRPRIEYSAHGQELRFAAEILGESRLELGRMGVAYLRQQENTSTLVCLWLENDIAGKWTQPDDMRQAA